jgi:LysR family transcriptional regulator, glycine cleavage system transcriptional activator
MEYLIAALTAAQTGSLTHSAEQLGVSHAAISRRIAGAENWAGIKLFSRHARGVTVTADGQRLLARVSEALDIVNHAADTWKKQRRTRTIRITTTQSFTQMWLLKHVAHIEAQLGNTRIEILTQSRNANLATEEVDLAIRYGRGGWKVGKEQRLFDEEHLYAVMNANTAKTLSQPIRPSDVLKQPLIHSVDSTAWSTWARAQNLEYRGRSVDRIMADSTLVIAAVQAGLGAAVLTAPLFHPMALPEDVCVVRGKKALCPLRYVLVTPARELPDVVHDCAQHILTVASMTKG